jgi:hypothetical protein
MLFVAASRLTTSGKFSYLIQLRGEKPLVTFNVEEAKEELLRLRAADPERLLAHVREWGSVEVYSRPTALARLEKRPAEARLDFFSRRGSTQRGRMRSLHAPRAAVELKANTAGTRHRMVKTW